MFVELKPLTTSERGLSNIIGINDLINRVSTWYPHRKRKPGRPKTTLRRELLGELEDMKISPLSDASSHAKSKKEPL